MSRSALGLPDGFLFLYCFDFDSVFERKNPLGVIEAFRRAFPEPQGPTLVVKSVRGDAYPEQMAVLRAAGRGRDDILVFDRYLTEHEQDALMDACDAYVSLHRAEGFGFTLAEAMALGKPVIATAYSGNLEFMDATNSRLVDFRLVDIPDGCDPYPTDARWADPDLDDAASAMREIAADRAASRELGSRAADDIALLHGVYARVPLVVDRLNEIDALRRLWAMEDPGRPWTSVESVQHYIGTGPDVGTPTRYGFLSRLGRRIVMRLVRHFAEHQDRLHSSLAASVRELERRLAAQDALVAELRARLRSFEPGPAPAHRDLEPGAEQAEQRVADETSVEGAPMSVRPLHDRHE